MKEKVIAAIAREFCLSDSEVEMDSSLRDLVTDSLELVNLQLELEAEFEIEIPDEEMQKLATVKDIVDYVESH